MTRHWSVQDAKARLSELLRLARKGEPQRIGVNDTCVLISEETWSALQDEDLGSWLIESAPRGKPIALPPRSSKRTIPFEKSRAARRR